MGRSIVWKHFTKNNNGTATCQLCQKTLKTSAPTIVCAKDIEETTKIITVLRPLEAATEELCCEQICFKYLWNNHENIVQQSSCSLGRATREEIGYPSELNLYLKSAVGRLTDNLLLLWNDITTVYPTLSNVALKYLSTVATSVPCERLFFKAGMDYESTRKSFD
ncbi:hypothetical protein QTP88_006315 [Uroleucon formosanum]